MKYKVGDRVRIKSLDWYNKNKNSVDNYDVVFANGWVFSKPMSNFCGKELIIEKISHATNPPHYIMKDTMFAWTDEMIEGLVEEETKFDTASNPLEIKSNANCLTRERVDALAIKIDKELPSGNQYVWELPDGYQFVDENGNVINATKIVLEKKKKEYPKTYEECCKVLDVCSGETLQYGDLTLLNDYEFNLYTLLENFRKLLICRDAYWKIAGDWRPEFRFGKKKYCIMTKDNKVISATVEETNRILAFPTKEMRDAFYENFKEEIEICKELL